MNTREQLLKLSPEIYSGHHTVALFVEKIIGNTPVRLLSIGRAADELQAFIPTVEVTSFDCKKQPTKTLPFETESFDIVVAVDIVNHLPEADHAGFLKELGRVSKNILIIAAPFQKNYTENIENIVRQQYIENSGAPHPSLNDHQKFGLPQEEHLENILQTQGHTFIKVGQGNMTLWSLHQLYNGMKQGESGTEVLTTFDEYCNRHLSELGTFREPTYRTFYVIAKKNDSSLAEIKKTVASNDGFSIKTFAYLLKIAFSDARKMLNRRKKQLDMLANRMIEAQQKLQTLNLEIASADALRRDIRILKEESTLQSQKIDSLNEKLEKLEAAYTLLRQEKTLLEQHSLDQSAVIADLKSLITRQENLYEELKTHALHQDDALAEKKHSLERREEEIVTLHQTIASQQAMLLEIQSTWLWKLLHFLHPAGKTSSPLEKQQGAQPLPPAQKPQDWQTFSYQPVISIVLPVDDEDEKKLIKTIESVCQQEYPRWEMCIANDIPTNENIRILLEKYRDRDPRFKIIRHQKKEGIVKTSNDALKMATGAYVAFLDVNGEVKHNAFFNVIKALQEKKYDFLYTDEEVQTQEEGEYKPLLKPDWSPDLLLSLNYIGHFAVYRRKLLTDIGDFQEKLNGAHHYDLALRCTEKTSNIKHIGEILYRQHFILGKINDVETDTEIPEASLKAIQATLKRRGVAGEVIGSKMPGTYRIRHYVKSQPLVSIIIAFKDESKQLEKTLTSIFTQSTYPRYEIILVDCGSEYFATLEYLRTFQNRPNVQLCKHSGPKADFEAFRYGASKATGEMLVFIKNGVEILTPDGFESMLEHAVRQEVLAVNATPVDALHSSDPTSERITGSQIPFSDMVKNLLHNDTALNLDCCMFQKNTFPKIEAFFNPSTQDTSKNTPRIVTTPYSSYRLE